MKITKTYNLNARLNFTFAALLTTFTFLTASPIYGGQVAAMDLAGDSDDVTIGQREYSPFLNRGYSLRVYWGDTHVHTSYSTDAGMFGNRLGPDEAYRFARGEEVVSSAGVRARLSRPLDFLVVADHAENLGLAPMITESNPDLLRIPWGREVHDMVKSGKPGDAYAAWGTAVSSYSDPIANKAVERTMWERITAFAEQFNQPGVFTALIGFEWTSSPDGNNLHRNVIYRGDKAGADLVLPISSYDTVDPEELWDWMAGVEEKTGGKVLALAHNGNLSNGLMFDNITLTGKKPLDRDYAERRMRWEPLYEVTQMKGDGESHPALSPNDEFADYGTWDKGSFGSAKDDDMIPREYAREALKRGLRYEQELGVNPFKFGMVGSTDSHTSLATAEENNYFGKATPGEPGQKGRLEEMVTGYLPDPQGRDYTILHKSTLGAGLAAVWATENTRAGIFDAMQRKEVYATTGTRISLRVFAGWDFEEADVQRPDFVEIGYQHGVPMGGDLNAAPQDASATLVIRALRDPDGANLDRVQVVKGWVDGEGELREQVYDVVCSDDRPVNDQYRCDVPVGNTVNVETATFTNSIGNALLMGHWKDPGFDQDQSAFYYVRVLEIPTPRWTTYDAAFFGTNLPEGVPATHQERAYSSPIWYTP